jgi:hypothetical protein
VDVQRKLVFLMYNTTPAISAIAIIEYTHPTTAKAPIVKTTTTIAIKSNIPIFVPSLSY